MPKLTLDEMAQIAEKVTNWHIIDSTDFTGYMDNLRLKVRLNGVFWKGKGTAEVFVDYHNCEGKYGLEIYEIGHEKGKQVYTIYQKVESYVKRETEKRLRESGIKEEQKRALAGNNIRGKFLGGPNNGR